MDLPISVVIIARDEAAVIGDCLASVKGFAEIIVVLDDRTHDSTEGMAQGAGAKVFKEKFINFSQIKNFGLEKATQPWTLLLDADERVSPQLHGSLELLPQDGHIGYLLPFRNHLRGKWLRFGGMYPDYHLRLFRTGSAHYEGEVHEKLQIAEGSVGTLQGDIIHFTYPSKEVLFRKVRQYAEIESKDHPHKGILRAMYHAAKRFLGVYLFRLGFIDGTNGLLNALALAQYQYLLYKPQG